MRYVCSVLSVIGLLVAFLASALDLHAQGGSATTDPLRARRQSVNARRQPARGLSTDANLARHRWQGGSQARLPTAPRWRRSQASRGTIYSAPYYAITTPWAIPNLRSDPYQAARSTSTRKPFAGARPAPTAVDRYWPLLYEAREDPKTGLIIWSLP